MTKPDETQAFPFKNPAVKVKPEVRFLTGDDEEAFKVAVAPVPSVKVKVREPFRVVHDGAAYVGGQVLNVPADEQHRFWVASGWVELVKPATDKRATSKKESK